MPIQLLCSPSPSATRRWERGAEYCRKNVCSEPDTLVPQVCRALWEWEVSRYCLGMSSTKLQKQLWPLLHSSFQYIKRNSEWVRNGERAHGKRAVMFRTRKRMGMEASSVDWSSLSSCPCYTRSTHWNGFLQHTAKRQKGTLEASGWTTQLHPVVAVKRNKFFISACQLSQPSSPFLS